MNRVEFIEKIVVAHDVSKAEAGLRPRTHAFDRERTHTKICSQPSSGGEYNRGTALGHLLQRVSELPARWRGGWMVAVVEMGLDAHGVRRRL